jgi:hypothetical protein
VEARVHSFRPAISEEARLKKVGREMADKAKALEAS